jgi:hypothetical protein
MACLVQVTDRPWDASSQKMGTSCRKTQHPGSDRLGNIYFNLDQVTGKLTIDFKKCFL